MSATIDQRVVEMRFDNKNFESNAKTSMSTLDRLKQSLNLSGAAKGLDSINTAAKNVNVSGLGSAVDTVRARFSALGVMGVTALANITNSAVNAGKRIVSALTIDPIKAGFSEYETKINAIQTILSNTASKGTTMKDVTRVIDELNTYADKTIYNFSEMTRNIGTFTAAGVGLEESASAIQGIANLAAASGSTSQQASTAMYQLSQALAAGTVKLMDWNSVVNAGMGGEKFQEALKATARDHGIAVDSIIKKNGSFRDSLQEGWITADILNETLNKFTVEGAKNYSKSMVEAGKWTQEQADALVKEAQAMEDAATKVKTFTQLWDTLKEAAQSGWGKSWEIIVGDFEEAKELFSEISDVLGGLINDSADARNKVLQGWKDKGGRIALVDSLKNAFEGISSIIKPISEAFREIFPPVTADRLVAITNGLKEFTANLKLSGERADKVKRIFKGIFSIFDIVGKAIAAVTGALFDLSGSKGISSLADFLLDITASIGDFFTSLNESFDTGGLTGGLSKIVSGISNVLDIAVEKIRNFGDIFSSIGKVISDVAGVIWNAIKSVFGWITENVSAGDIFAGLAGGGIFVAAKKLSGLFGTIKDAIDNLFGRGEDNKIKIGEKFAEVMDSVKGTLQSFTTGVKATTLVSIAVAVGILSMALKTISELDVLDISKSLFAIGVLITGLSLGFRSITKSLSKFDSKGVVKSGIALVLMATAIKILADAMVKLSELSMSEIAKSLIAVGGGLVALSVGLKIIGGTKVSLSTSVAMLALAESCKILADALAKFGKMAWDEIGRGLTAMGGALGELVITLGVLSKVGGGGSLLGSVGILIAVQSLSELADSLKKFGQMSWDEIGRGLTAMGGALGELGIVLGALGKIAGFSSILGAGAILIVIQGLDDLANALAKFGSMAWDEIGRGLTAMGGALAETGLAAGLTGLAGLSGIFGAGSILIVIQGLDNLANALKKFGEMSWDEIGRGLTAMGGALAETGLAAALTGFAGLSGIFGAGSILIVIQGLDQLANALGKFGSMTWDEIGRGLTAMAGALAETGLAAALTGFSGLAGIIGGGSILLVIQGLDDLANALKKFGEMDWDEIGRGLTAMGAAMGEVALGGLLNTLSGFGASAIAEVAAPLGTLADSIKKWMGVEVPEGLGVQLSLLAGGIESFTFGGWGAGTIATAAPAIGTLADSVRKWSTVTVPDGLEDDLKQIANGIKAFSFAFMGGWSISAIAEPLSNLAGSVSKWNGVAVPEGLEDGLKQIADGVKAFSFAFMGGWSISAIIQPLSDLAGSVKKWNGVNVPEGLEGQLESLADGVKAFSFAFMGGWSLGAVNGPLGDLATSVKKWNGVSIPPGLGSKLKFLAEGVKSFSGIGDISSVSKNINTISSAVSKLSKVDFQSITSGLTDFVNSASNLGSASASLSNFGKNLVNGLIKSIKNGEGHVKSAVGTLVKNTVSSFSKGMSGVSSATTSAGLKMAKSLADGIISGSSLMPSAITRIMTTSLNSIRRHYTSFNTAGKMISTQLINGLRANSARVSTILVTPIKSALANVRTYYASFYSAGSSLVSGFSAGIRDNISSAASAAAAMSAAASAAAKAKLKINSPSKVFMGIGSGVVEGFVKGINDNVSDSYNAAYGIADTAKSGFSRAISNIKNVINSDMDMQPTIRPVVDLSDVQSGAGVINRMLDMNSSVGIMANVGTISSMMNRRNQNGGNTEIVSAIDKLRKDLSNVGNTTYQIDGITYDDGSNVSDAVKTLVRAARVERRI